ncbi:MAG: glycosyltransferase [Clostridia bacterium]|nr:glycosyltransferase [Clostridia bacterium]
MNNNAGNPWLSVVVPIYNAERYLSKCIRSILSQTFTDFELILVDDGSTDSSSEICKRFLEKDPRVKYFRKENGGCLQTRIFGVERAAGKYIIFCDADDYYYNEKSFEIIKNSFLDGDYDFIQFGVVNKLPYVKKNKNIPPNLAVEKKSFLEYDYPILLCSYFEYSKITGNVWNKVYKKELFENVPKSKDIEKIFMGEDFILNLHLLKDINKALYIYEQIYVYRNLLGGSGSFRKNEMKNMSVLKDYQWSFLQKWNGEYKDKVVRMHFAETAGWLYNHVQNSIKYLSEEEIKEMILNALELPNVQRAREYLKNNNENYPEFKLLVAGDPDLYISEAKKLIENRSMKEKLKDLAKNVLRKILK